MPYSPEKNTIWMFGKLSEALVTIVTHTGDARHRVWSAALYLLMVDPQSMPKPVAEYITCIHKMLKRYPPDEIHSSALDATFYRTRNVTASKIASLVLDAYAMMQNILCEQRRRPREPVRYEVSGTWQP